MEAWISGDTPNISCLYEFAWYEWVWFIDPNLPDKDKRCLGRWLGPSYDVGEEMCSFIFTDKAKVITRTSVWPLSVEDNNSDPVKQLKESFDSSVKSILKDRAEPIAREDDPAADSTTPVYERYADNVDDATAAKQLEDSEIPEADDHPTAEAFNNWIGSQVYLPRGDQMQYAKVTGRKRNADGNYIGQWNQNPILNTAVYEVEFPDGTEQAYSANVIAQNIYSRVDDEGREYLVLDEIIDHRKDGTAVAADDAFLTTKSGNKVRRRTTKGWWLCVKWKDGSTSWESLKDMKEANPVEVAEYAVANKLLTEAAFGWWVPFTIKRRDRIIKAVKARVLKKQYQFGI